MGSSGIISKIELFSGVLFEKYCVNNVRVRQINFTKRPGIIASASGMTIILSFIMHAKPLTSI